MKRWMIPALVVWVAIATGGCTENSDSETAGQLTSSHESNEEHSNFEERHEAFLAKLIDTLGLTAEQEEQFRAIHERLRERIRDLRSGFNQGISREEMSVKLTGVHAEIESELKAVLSEEQYSQFEAMRPPRPDGNKERSFEGQQELRERHITFLTKQLDLTAEQQQLIKSKLEEMETEFQANSSQSTFPRPPSHPKKRLIEAIHTILTDEQLTKLQELKGSRDRTHFKKSALFLPDTPSNGRVIYSASSL